MSETFAESKAAFHRLRNALRHADEDTRWAFGFWAAGIAIMSVAVVIQFGWTGALFGCGLVLCAAGNQGLSRS